MLVTEVSLVEEDQRLLVSPERSLLYETEALARSWAFWAQLKSKAGLLTQSSTSSARTENVSMVRKSKSDG